MLWFAQRHTPGASVLVNEHRKLTAHHSKTLMNRLCHLYLHPEVQHLSGLIRVHSSSAWLESFKPSIVVTPAYMAR